MDPSDYIEVPGDYNTQSLSFSERNIQQMSECIMLVKDIYNYSTTLTFVIDYFGEI